MLERPVLTSLSRSLPNDRKQVWQVTGTLLSQLELIQDSATCQQWSQLNASLPSSKGSMQSINTQPKPFMVCDFVMPYSLWPTQFVVDTQWSILALHHASYSHNNGIRWHRLYIHLQRYLSVLCKFAPCRWCININPSNHVHLLTH